MYNQYLDELFRFLAEATSMKRKESVSLSALRKLRYLSHIQHGALVWLFQANLLLQQQTWGPQQFGSAKVQA